MHYVQQNEPLVQVNFNIFSPQWSDLLAAKNPTNPPLLPAVWTTQISLHYPHRPQYWTPVPSDPGLASLPDSRALHPRTRDLALADCSAGAEELRLTAPSNPVGSETSRTLCMTAYGAIPFLVCLGQSYHPSFVQGEGTHIHQRGCDHAAALTWSGILGAYFL